MGSGGRGVCYFAETPEGCFIEVFRSFTTIVPAGEVETRRLARISLPRDLVLADCTVQEARAWGITAEIHATPEYKETQSWADAFAAAGFDGIRYLLRHDPAQRLAGIALFGPAGPAPDLSVLSSEPIGAEVTDEVRHRFGMRVVRKP